MPAILALANSLQTSGDRCSLIVKRVDRAVWHGEAARRLDAFMAVSSPREVFHALWRAAPDVVHVHFVGWSLPATSAAYARGARVIWHLHSAMEDRMGPMRRWARGRKYNWFGAGVHRFVTVSDALRRATIDLGVAPSRTLVLRNGVDTRHFRPPTLQERAASRRSLGIGDDDRVVLYFGRDIAIKGADILWRALDDSPPLVLLAVGAPSQAVAEFSARARTIALPFVADPFPLYCAADVLVMPSRREGAPYTMLEALCSGVPIVAGNIAPLAEIAAEVPGVLLVPNDPAALGRALRVRFERVAESDAVRGRFGLERWVRDVRGLYDAA